jgi:hypothetical protein
MDINRMGSVYPHSISKSRSVSGTGTGDTAFNSIFETQISQTCETGQPPSKTLSEEKSAVLARGDRILTLLDTYATDLNTPGKMLKQMEPLVSTIQGELTHMRETVADQFAQDRSLQHLVNELSVTADVAIFKFYRGDFI